MNANYQKYELRSMHSATLQLKRNLSVNCAQLACTSVFKVFLQMQSAPQIMLCWKVYLNRIEFLDLWPLIKKKLEKSWLQTSKRFWLQSVFRFSTQLHEMLEIRLRRNIFFNFTLLICTQFLVLFTTSLGHLISFRCRVVWSYNKISNTNSYHFPNNHKAALQSNCRAVLWLVKRYKAQKIGISIECSCDGATKTK